MPDGGEEGGEIFEGQGLKMRANSDRSNGGDMHMTLKKRKNSEKSTSRANKRNKRECESFL